MRSPPRRRVWVGGEDECQRAMSCGMNEGEDAEEVRYANNSITTLESCSLETELSKVEPPEGFSIW